jgi:hypothetical protein
LQIIALGLLFMQIVAINKTGDTQNQTSRRRLIAFSFAIFLCRDNAVKHCESLPAIQLSSSANADSAAFCSGLVRTAAAPAGTLNAMIFIYM